MILDGELYIHGETFQTITSLVKKLQKNSETIKYHVYDCVIQHNPEMKFNDRLSFLKKWFNKTSFKNVEMVNAHLIKNKDEIFKFHSKFLNEEYEGAIVRNVLSSYKFKYRSSDLLKVKSFRDAEYKVISWERGTGRFKDCVIWVCTTNKDKIFRVISKGTMEERQKLLNTAQDYIGEWLKVKYFNLTDDGVPRFPIGVGFRLKDDM